MKPLPSLSEQVIPEKMASDADDNARFPDYDSGESSEISKENVKKAGDDFSSHFVIRRQSSSTDVNQSKDDDVKVEEESREKSEEKLSSKKKSATFIEIEITVGSKPEKDAPAPVMKDVAIGIDEEKETSGESPVSIEESQAPPKPEPVTPPPTPTTVAPACKTPNGRIRHPFMNAFASLQKSPKFAPALKVVKMPTSSMDTSYEPISQYCIQDRPSRTLQSSFKSPLLESNTHQKTLQVCGQLSPIPIDLIFNELRDITKIGEGVYGEVYSAKFRCLTDHKWVYKVVAIEGDFLVNGERQKKCLEILPEIVVSQTLNRLNEGYKECQTKGFVYTHNARIAVGKYPSQLVHAWDLYNDDFDSDNDKPDFFADDQLYMVLEFEFAGLDVETITFKDARQCLSIVLQVAHTLAVGESALEFEHRDLHWGNIMIESCKEPEITFTLNGSTLSVPSHGIKVCIIDFTISRLKQDTSPICLDLQDDEEQFLGEGDHQFDIYRMMRDLNRNDWQKFTPKTNIFWLHYLANKFAKKGHYIQKNRDDQAQLHHKRGAELLIKFSHAILEYESATAFVKSYECTTDYKLFLS